MKCIDRHGNHPNEPSLVGDPDRFAKAANLLTMTRYGFFSSL
jgi:hypothetical protein